MSDQSPQPTDQVSSSPSPRPSSTSRSGSRSSAAGAAPDRRGRDRRWPCSIVLYVITPALFRATTVLQIERRPSVAVAMQQAAPYRGLGRRPDVLPDPVPPAARAAASRSGWSRTCGWRTTRRSTPARGSLMGAGSAGAATADADASALGGLATGCWAAWRSTRSATPAWSRSRTPPRSPELAARVANGVAEAFIDWGVENRFATVGRASSFLASQIESIKQEIQDKEAQLQAYCRRTDIVALDPASNVTLQRLEALNSDYVTAVSERIARRRATRSSRTRPDDAVADTVCRRSGRASSAATSSSWSATTPPSSRPTSPSGRRCRSSRRRSTRAGSTSTAWSRRR